MKALIIIIAFINLYTVIKAGPTSRVVGGVEAVDGKYSYQVLLKLYGDFFCSGSILNSQYILTAAHCLVGRTTHGITVTVGTNSKSYGVGDVYEVEKLIVHENFDRFLAINDIGLIRLKEIIAFSKKVQTVQLPSENVNASGINVRLSGWGQVGKLNSDSNVLLEVELSIISNEKCNESWNKIKDTQICTLTKAGEGACNGDSGGPLTMENNVQVGIVSYGEACAVGIPDVYTRVYSFIDWIRKNSEPLSH